MRWLSRFFGFELYRVVWSAPRYPGLRQDIRDYGIADVWARGALDAVRRARLEEGTRLEEVFPA